MATALEFGLQESQEEVKSIRGTNRQILRRIRRRYALNWKRVSIQDIFYHACAGYHGAINAAWKSARDFRAYRKDRILPFYVIRCGDEDTLYPSMRELQLRLMRNA